MENLDLSGAQTAELDITKLTRLHNFDLSNSAVEAIVAADAASYTNVYRWNWENAKLDLSDNTAEGKLKAGIADYFATHEVPDEVSQEGTQVGSGDLDSWSGGTLNLTLSSECFLADVTVTNPYSSYGWYDNLTQFSVGGFPWTERSMRRLRAVRHYHRYGYAANAGRNPGPSM